MLQTNFAFWDIFMLLRQRCCWVFKSGWASSNVVGIICPLVVIGLTELSNSGPPSSAQRHHWFCTAVCWQIRIRFVTSKNETMNYPIHKFKVQQNVFETVMRPCLSKKSRSDFRMQCYCFPQQFTEKMQDRKSNLA